MASSFAKLMSTLMPLEPIASAKGGNVPIARGAAHANQLHLNKILFAQRDRALPSRALQVLSGLPGQTQLESQALELAAAFAEILVDLPRCQACIHREAYLARLT